MCDMVNHTHYPKEDHLPDWVCWDKHGIEGDCVECIASQFRTGLWSSGQWCCVVSTLLSKHTK